MSATPFFIFAKEKLLINLQTFQKFFPGASIHYAMKANSETEILQTLFDAGSSFEVASIYELAMLKKIHVPPEKIIFGTSVKPVEHIKHFFDYGVDRFAFDSFVELEKIASVAPQARVYVRALVNDTGSAFQFSEKFGAALSEIIPLLLRARELGLRPYGVSFHVGSQASNPRAWAEAIKSLRPIIKKLKDKGITVETLNLGGGYPCKYASAAVPELSEIVEHTFKAYKTLPYKPQLVLEPGRAIVADTGTLVASVIGRVERKGKPWLFLDVGVYNGMFETMAYQGLTRYPVKSMSPLQGSKEQLFSLAGPTGDSPDVISREALLPADIKVGDKLVFYNVGAYTLVAVSPFNGFPKPDVYFI